MPVGHAESLTDQIGFERLEQLGENVEGFDARAIFDALMAGDISLNPQAIEDLLAALRHRVWEALSGLTRRLAMPVAVALIARAMLAEGSAAVQALNLICRMTALRALIVEILSALTAALNVMSRAEEVSDVLMPVMSSALTLSGMPATAALLSPVSALSAALINRVLKSAVPALCSVGVAAIAAGSLSDRYPMDRLFALIKGIGAGLLVSMLAAFMALLALEGRVGAAQDSAAVKTVRFAVENLLPVIGGELSGTVESLNASASVVRSAAGGTGLVLIAMMFAGPLARLLAQTLAVKLAAAVLEPLSDQGFSKALDRVGDMLEILLASAAASVALVILLVGAGMSAAGQLIAG